MTYRYRGTTFTEDDTPTNRNGCGTYPGYRTHKRHGEQPCQDCRDAMNTYSRDRYHRLKAHPAEPRTFNPQKCGTRANYVSHLRYNVPPCQPCRDASAQYMAEYRRKE